MNGTTLFNMSAIYISNYWGASKKDLTVVSNSSYLIYLNMSSVSPYIISVAIYTKRSCWFFIWNEILSY